MILGKCNKMPTESQKLIFLQIKSQNIFLEIQNEFLQRRKCL